MPERVMPVNAGVLPTAAVNVVAEFEGAVLPAFGVVRDDSAVQLVADLGFPPWVELEKLGLDLLDGAVEDGRLARCDFYFP